MDELLKEAKKIPVTASLCVATLAVTLPPILQIVSPYPFFFSVPAITKGFQVWRLITPFFFGSSGLPLVFDLFMLYRDSLSIEQNHFGTRPASYAWAIMLINLGILALSYPLRAVVFFRPMLLAIVYLNTRLNPGGQVSLFGMITVPAQYFPWLLLIMDGAQGGIPYLMQSATGIISAHTVHTLLLSRPNHPLAEPPSFMKRLMNPNAGVAQGGIRLGGVTAFAPSRNNAIPNRNGNTSTATSGSGNSSSGSGITGHRWPGSGNRLG